MIAFGVLLLWEGVAAALSPLVALVALAHPRLRAWARFGFPRAEVEPGCVWMHAASLGEGRVVAALAPEIRKRVPGVGLLRSYTSMNAADQDCGCDQSVAAPLDTPLFVSLWLDRVRPRCLVLVEAELWPCLLAACRRRGIPVAVVQARLGPGAARLRTWGLWEAVTSGLGWVAADAQTAALLPGAVVTGDLKVEAPVPPAVLSWNRPAIVAGSTHAGEEAILLDAWSAIAPRPLLVLAPRDPARFGAVATLLEQGSVAWARRSTLGPVVPPDVGVVLLDTVGELPGLYRHASAAFIGGTFDRAVGGHSAAEPRAAGCPIVVGPEVQGHIVGGQVFPATREDLASVLARAIAAPREIPAAAMAAQATAEHLDVLWSAPVPPERWLRWWLAPLAPVWALGVMMRGGTPAKVGMPVIGVGALTAGGSGKTPVAGWLAARFADREPVVVSRGYGRDAGEEVRVGGEASEIGDELAMLARRGIRVVSAPDRVAAIRAAAGAGIAILDDALQYPGVHRDLEVVVVDARWPLGGGPIPVGTGRVPARWLSRAHVVWVNHGTLPVSLVPFLRRDAVVVEARYRPVAWSFRGERLPLDAIPARPAVAFAGIARPEGFFSQVRRLGVTIARTGVFPDHHRFTWADLQNIEAWLDDHVVVTTEKDAARLPADAGVYALLIEPEVIVGAEALDALLSRFDR